MTSISGPRPAVACRHHRYWAEMVEAMMRMVEAKETVGLRWVPKEKNGRVRKTEISDECAYVCTTLSQQREVQNTPQVEVDSE